jgi:cytochrome-b5 reductase
LTPILQELKAGDEVQFKGPIVKYNWEEKQKSNVGMIAGGTGITPMLQVIRRVFHEDSTDKKTKITLLFGNQTESDILLKDELDKIAKENPDRFKVVYALDKAPENWTGVSGYITKEVVEANLPGPNEPDTVIMVCGPPPMVKSVAGSKNRMEQGELDGVLKELGYVKENVFKF